MNAVNFDSSLAMETKTSQPAETPEKMASADCSPAGAGAMKPLSPTWLQGPQGRGPNVFNSSFQ